MWIVEHVNQAVRVCVHEEVVPKDTSPPLSRGGDVSLSRGVDSSGDLRGNNMTTRTAAVGGGGDIADCGMMREGREEDGEEVFVGDQTGAEYIWEDRCGEQQWRNVCGGGETYSWSTGGCGQWGCWDSGGKGSAGLMCVDMRGGGGLYNVSDGTQHVDDMLRTSSYQGGNKTRGTQYIYYMTMLSFFCVLLFYPASFCLSLDCWCDRVVLKYRSCFTKTQAVGYLGSLYEITNMDKQNVMP
eukprot:GHVS01062198.1.p1 GENE.GHVS01062198.1~~GHVS01062198.1.p1  ORF type:complete len:241 (-),score=49.08 GHVS01062198.1:1156-1878(-)